MSSETKLPFWETINFSYGFLFSNITSFIKLFWLVGSISYGINVAIAYFYSSEYQFIGHLVQYLASVIFAVGWHRKIILGQPDPAISSYVRFTKVELKFFIMGGLVSSIMFIPLIALSAIAGASAGPAGAFVAALVTIIMSGFVMARLLLLFPIIAIGEKISIREVWKATSGNSARIYFGIAISMLPFSIISNFGISFTPLILKNFGLIAGITVEFSALVALFLGVASIAGFASRAYQTLCSQVLESNAEEPLEL